MYLEVVGVKKRFGNEFSYHQALDGVSFGVEKGQMCAILGRSGSGKSTLLNSIGGLDTIDAGEIRVGDDVISGFSASQLLEYRRKNIGFIFQFYNLVQNLTVKENIQVCEYLSRNPLNIDELLETLGLTEIQHRFPNQLSGGQQQRCAIARALVKNPQLLLCDEPTGALDSATAREIMSLLEKINQQYNTTILIVTHNSGIKQMMNKTVVLHDGKIESISENSKRILAVELEEL